MYKFLFQLTGALDRKFVLATLARQIEIAKQIRALDDKTRIVFSPDFVPTSTLRIGDFTVSADQNGRQAVLSSAAQQLFDADYYGRLSHDSELIRIKDSFYLPAVNLSSATTEIISACIPYSTQRPHNTD